MPATELVKFMPTVLKNSTGRRKASINRLAWLLIAMITFLPAICSGNSISKITPDGTSTTFATDSLFNCPNGLTIDPDNNLYACNFSDGRVFKITPTGEVSVFTTLQALFGGPNPVGNGHLTYSNGYLYATLIGIGQVQRICLEDGSAEGIAGRPFGFSNFDGPWLTIYFFQTQWYYRKCYRRYPFCKWINTVLGLSKCRPIASIKPPNDHRNK